MKMNDDIRNGGEYEGKQRRKPGVLISPACAIGLSIVVCRIMVVFTWPELVLGFAATAMAEDAKRSIDQIKTAIDASHDKLNQVLPNPRVLENGDQRITLSPVLLPVLRKFLADLSDLAAVDPGQAKDDLPDRTTALILLTVLGEKDAPLALGSLARSRDPSESQNGLWGQLAVRWVFAVDAAAQTIIIDDLEKLDAAHPDSDFWTWSTSSFMSSAATPKVKDRLFKLALAMNNPAVAAVQKMEERDRKIQSISENRPFVLAGKTVEGDDFTTTAWKGKVILVDFWATWCNPCVGELPRVKKMYAEYHTRGLEVVGVSNDYSASTLKNYIVKNNLPWPEFYDQTAADKKQWNPLATNLGIIGIPQMFLIDRKGICRTVFADDDMENLIPKLLAEPNPPLDP